MPLEADDMLYGGWMQGKLMAAGAVQKLEDRDRLLHEGQWVGQAQATINTLETIRSCFHTRRTVQELVAEMEQDGGLENMC